MAGSKTGTWTVVQASRVIARMVHKFGVTDLEARTNTAFYDCVIALVTCFDALAATDDYLLMKDASAPLGPEDIGGP